MPVKMSTKSGGKMKQLKSRLSKEYEFLKGVFSVLNLPANRDDDNADYEIVVSTKQEKEDNQLPNRARSITELEEKLQKIKSQHTFNLKNKLVKKSLSSKLNKKIKKKERRDLKRNLNKAYKKPKDEKNIDEEQTIKEEKVKMKSETTKPVYNMDSKLVFSKFDFSNMGQGGKQRHMKDPKKLLADLKDQEQKFKELSNNDEEGKVKQIKEKIAWKTVLQKAEGEKVKDDPTLLKKSIKKMEQKKKSSKKKWDERVQNVAEKKDERQKKRRENISKKKKDKKAKVVKAAVKRGRVVI